MYSSIHPTSIIRDGLWLPGAVEYTVLGNVGCFYCAQLSSGLYRVNKSSIFVTWYIAFVSLNLINNYYAFVSLNLINNYYAFVSLNLINN